MLRRRAAMDNERARYIEEGLPLVRAVARRVAMTLPRHVPLDDLIAAGHEGLVVAASRYDPERGVRFTTFAHHHVRGAMLDHVRRVCRDDPATRARASADAAVDALIVERLGADDASDAAVAATALGALLGEMSAAFTLAEIAAATAPSPPARDPEAAAFLAQQSAHLDTALERLPELERTMLHRVYFDGMSVSEAGEALGMSRSWAGRIHARALSTLREKLDPVADAL